MVKRYTHKCLVILLLGCSSQQLQAVDWFTATIGVLIAAIGLASDDDTQNTQRPTPAPTQQPQSRTQQTYAQQRPDKQQLFDSLDKKLQEIAGIDEQSAFIKEGLWKKKQEVVTNTLKQNFATHAQAEKYAFEHLPGGIREFFLTKVIENAQGKITSSQKEHDLKKLKKHFGHQIDQKLSNRRPVTDLFKNLTTDVDSYIKRHINNQRNTTPAQRPTGAHNDHRPSAPRLEEFSRPEPAEQLYPNIEEIQAQAGAFIEEILPKGETDIETFKGKTKYKDIYYTTDCAVCLKSIFMKKLKKRSTLRCGHQICTKCHIKCLDAQLKQNLQPLCPICRHPIDTKDFTVSYLRSKL